ncbi:MAG: M48 family metalloprotease [Pseudomonadota bacterium]
MTARFIPLAIALLVAGDATAADLILPVPSAEAFAFHEDLFWLWLLEQTAMLVVPAWLLLSGRGALIARSSLSKAQGRVWFGTLLFAGFTGGLYTLAGLAADGVRALQLTPYLARRPLDLPGWLAGQIVPTLGAVVALAVAGGLLNAIIRRSRRWWWAWVSGGVTILASIYLMVLPLMNETVRYPRIENTAYASWAPRLKTLAARASTQDVPVVVRKTVAGEFCPVQNSSVGLGPTRKIVLADRTFTDWTPEMVEASFAHELKHHLYDNTWFVVVLIAAMTGAGAFAIRVTGNAIVRRYPESLGFSALAEPAALPLLALLLQGYLLVAMPAFHLTAQRRELDADRFALDLTQDKQARVAVSGRQCGGLWLTEDPLFDRLYLNTHPSVAKRLRLANDFVLR